MAKDNTYSNYEDYSYHENSEYPTCAEGFDPFGNEEIDPDAGMDDFTGWPEGQEPDYDTTKPEEAESSWSAIDQYMSESHAAMLEASQKASENIQSMLTPEGMRKTFEEGQALLAELGYNGYSALSNAASNGYNTVSDIASSSYNTIGNALSSTASWAEEKGASFWDGTLVEDTIGACSEASTAAFDAISTAGGAIRDVVCDGISSAYESISSIID